MYGERIDSYIYVRIDGAHLMPMLMCVSNELIFCTLHMLEVWNLLSTFQQVNKVELDVDPQRDDDASQMSTYRCMLRPTWMISALQRKSKYKSNSISNFLKNFHTSGFPWCSTREDHSIDVSITNVGLILTKLRWFQLFVKSQNSNFELFWKNFKFLGFHGAVLVKTFPLMYQLIM